VETKVLEKCPLWGSLVEEAKEAKISTFFFHSGGSISVANVAPGNNVPDVVHRSESNSRIAESKEREKSMNSRRRRRREVQEEDAAF
jgi:hypothetical protein